MKLAHVEFPAELNRNAPSVQALGAEHTGSILIKYACELAGYRDLADKDVLDLGCGTRFTQAIINCAIPIGSYTGIEIDLGLVAYLRENVPDERFAFHYWHIYHDLYNPAGPRLTHRTKLPVAPGMKFDAMWMFSVITHNRPEDTESLLRILRRHAKRDTCLLFSAFIDNQLATFEDRVKDQPLLKAYYNEGFLRSIIARAGWQLESAHEADPDRSIMNHFVCRPKPVRFGLFRGT